MNLFRSESGSALVEFGLVLPLIMLVIMGTENYTLRLQQTMQVVEAASAGAAYGTVPGKRLDTAGMQTAAMNAAPGVSGMTATASAFWTCTSGGAHVTSGTICSGYGTPIQYVSVTTSATIPALFQWPGLAPNITVQQTATYRVPWIP